MTAHVAGLPLEESVALLAGTTASLLVARGWLAVHLRHRREPRK